MRSPHSLRNGETPNPHHHFHSTVSLQKLRRFNFLILIFRFASFCFSLTSTIFMATNSRGPNSPNWRDFDSFRFVLAANAIVALYSFVEMGGAVWEILKGTTVLPEILQVWFDFGHDQVKQVCYNNNKALAQQCTHRINNYVFNEVPKKHQAHPTPTYPNGRGAGALFDGYRSTLPDKVYASSRKKKFKRQLKIFSMQLDFHPPRSIYSHGRTRKKNKHTKQIPEAAVHVKMKLTQTSKLSSCTNPF